MSKLLALLSMIMILSCGDSQTTTSQPPLLEIKNIAGHSVKEVAAALGEATEMEPIKIEGKKNPKYSYKAGAVEIVFINGKADWITVTLNNGTFDKTALGIIGLPAADPAFSNPNVMRWKDYEEIQSISLFPKEGGIDYFYIKTLTE
ncbi:hypothetical protein [Runella sp.]|uniref:hypothetical protein n=1 Tax=Runella sp. TaxID=1960881 RepID=UPI003D148A72